MANPYIKSVLLLASFGGGAYILQLLTAPSAAKIEKIKASVSSAHLTEDEKKKILFMRRLKQAANEQPIYLQKKE